MTLQEFYDALEKHDWFYDFAEGSAYFRGKEAHTKISKQAQQLGTEFVSLMKSYSAYVWSGPNFGSEKLSKPERPGGPKIIEPNTDAF